MKPRKTSVQTITPAELDANVGSKRTFEVYAQADMTLALLFTDMLTVQRLRNELADDEALDNALEAVNERVNQLWLLTEDAAAQ